MNYKEAGVDVEAGYRAVDLMKRHVKNTYTPGVITDLGGFGGLFSLGQHKMEEPCLVAGTDGVGTKLKVAFELDQHDSIGIDCVAMCVNDIICSGAKPLFFLDYIACGKNYPEKIAEIVKGIADGCQQGGMALIGGETAEMPGFYPENEYDLAGFAVGIVDRKQVIDGSQLEEGDVLVGLPSSGIHSNGYSLVRRLFDMTKEELEQPLEEGSDVTIGEVLLTPTKIYVKQIQSLLAESIQIKAISHVTGGGFIENIPRMLLAGLQANIEKGSWPVLPIFHALQKRGQIEERDMYNTFNMGIGMVLALSKEEASKAIALLKAQGEEAYLIGEITKGEEEIVLC